MSKDVKKCRPWKSTNLHQNLMDIHRCPWISIDIHGYPWTSMDWLSMDVHGFPWIPCLRAPALQQAIPCGTGQHMQAHASACEHLPSTSRRWPLGKPTPGGRQRGSTPLGLGRGGGECRASAPARPPAFIGRGQCGPLALGGPPSPPASSLTRAPRLRHRSPPGWRDL